MLGNSTYWEKKVSLIAFRQVLTKFLPAACIQLHTYDLFEKAMAPNGVLNPAPSPQQK